MAPCVCRILNMVASGDNRKKYVDYLDSRNEWQDDLSLFDFVKFDYGGQFRRDMVESVERLTRLLPVFLSLVPYFYFKTSFNAIFRAQGLQMQFPSWDRENATLNLNDTSYTLKRPVSWYSLGLNLIFVGVLIPIMLFLNSDCFRHIIFKFKMCLYKIRGQKDTLAFDVDLPLAFSAAKDHKRLLTGLFLGFVSISLAIAVDLVRHYKFNECLTSNEHIIDQCIIRQEYNGCTFVASHFSVLWQLPQQLAASISQVFVVVTAYQIAYLQAPDYESEPYKMQGIFIGLCFLAKAIGAAFVLSLSNLLNLVSAFCIYNSSDDTKCQLPDGKLYWYYVIIAGIQLIGIALSIYAFKKFFRWAHGET
ncbi:solute carrier family 15 member 4-like [Symsagittifera roscoffensis]|uniref:solute carrier family 15 member 4-like n=1 Tax=Symsagittifera roscoffensis TaxID=84072 RepID=UPI00307BA486